MHAWISLGSNQGQPEAHLNLALRHLQNLDGTNLKRCSGFYRTAPWGKVDQDAFINAVALIETTHPPLDLLNLLLGIESQMGRERTVERWGPRCIDLDLLTYNDEMLKSAELELPHPRMHLRAFVLRPLLELDPDFVIPGIGPAAECLLALEPQEVECLGSADEFDGRDE